MQKLLLTLVLLFLVTSESFAFCGFYVAKADAKLFNKSSQVIIARDGNRTVVTMSNDFKGNVKDFAMVIPVPEVLKKEQIRIAEAGLFEQFDAYSGPRLAEYYDENPCEPTLYLESVVTSSTMSRVMGSRSKRKKKPKDYGVTIQATYKVEEYDIVILSAKRSNGLEEWLKDNGYKIPAGAREVLEPYVKNDLKFFVVKVDMEKVKKTGPFTKLRPLQIEYNSSKFMLPIRLGMANASESQDMIVYALSKKGRVEVTNYRTVELPSNQNIPLYIKNENKFGPFYKDLFERKYESENRQAVFLEYAWDATPTNPVKCDPCVGPPPLLVDWHKAGATWSSSSGTGGGERVFFTRLHVRYDREHFPQDLIFQETPNRKNFQCRYVIYNPPNSRNFDCEEAQSSLKFWRNRREMEIENLKELTGWEYADAQTYIGEFDKDIKRKQPDRKVPNRNGIGWLLGGLFLLVGIRFWIRK